MRGRPHRDEPTADEDADPIAPIAAAAALIALVGWIAWSRWQFLSSSIYPWGVDGYFYPIQLRAILETGSLHYPSAPLAFWLMTPLAAIGGEIWAVKVVSAVATALVAAPIYGVCRELGAERGPALAAAAIAASASASFYFATEFVKNGVGVTVAMFALWAILAAQRAPSRRRIAIAAALIAAAWLSHKSAAAIVLLTAAPLALPWLLERRTRRLAIAAVGGVALLAIALLFPGRFIGLADLGLLRDLFSGDLDFRLPVLRHADGRRFYFGHEVAAALVATAAFWLLWWRRGGPRRAALVVSGLSVLVLVSALPMLEVADPNALGFRLRLLAFVATAIAAGAALSIALRERSALTRAAVGVAVAGFVLALRPATYLEPVVEQHPALVAAVRAADGLVPESAVVVTPKRGLVFMTTWFTRRAAAQRPEAIAAERRFRLVPLPLMSPALLAAITAERAADASGAIRSLHPYDPMGLVLMPEASWRRVLERLDGKTRAIYEAWPTD